MLAMKYESSNVNSQRKTSMAYKMFQRGDRVITNNSRLGTIVRVDKDDQGEYLVVNLDILPGEFAYDAWDLEKV
jgi:preprotein translocase subunit YajC